MNSWGYLSGLLRAERVHALSNSDFSALSETQDAESLSKALDDTVYGELFQGRTLRDFTVVFDEYYQKKLAEIKEISPETVLLKVYGLNADLNNFKLCYKAKVSNKQVSWEQLSERGDIEPEKMFSIVENELWNELPDAVSKAVVSLDAKESLRQVDFAMDKAYYEEKIQMIAKECKQESALYKGILDLYKKELDCENIKNILRASAMDLDKNQIAEILLDGGYVSSGYYDSANSSEEAADLVKNTAYGEVLEAGVNEWLATKSCTLLEKQIDEYILDISADFAYCSEGPAVVEETLRALQLEIKNLKLIIIGKLNDMSVEEIKERLRNVR